MAYLRKARALAGDERHCTTHAHFAFDRFRHPKPPCRPIGLARQLRRIGLSPAVKLALSLSNGFCLPSGACCAPWMETRHLRNVSSRARHQLRVLCTNPIFARSKNSRIPRDGRGYGLDGSRLSMDHTPISVETALAYYEPTPITHDNLRDLGDGRCLKEPTSSRS